MKAKVAYSSGLACNEPLSVALETLASVGATKVDLLCVEGWAHLNPSALAANFEAEVRRIEALFGRHGMQVVALNTMTSVGLQHRAESARATREKETAALLALMERWGIAAAALQPPLRDGPAWTDGEREDVVGSIFEAGALAANAGRSLALELHTRSPFEKPAEIAWLLEKFPGLPLVYDASHLVAQGVAIRETAALLANARIVHLRDAAVGKLQAPYGEGAVDFDWVLGELKERGFDGQITIEYLGSRDAGFDVKASTQRLYERVLRAFE